MVDINIFSIFILIDDFHRSGLPEKVEKKNVEKVNVEKIIKKENIEK
jgi:hypothetical protein